MLRQQRPKIFSIHVNTRNHMLGTILLIYTILVFNYNHITNFFYRMSSTYTSTFLEQRLREELETKLIVAQRTTKIPTDNDILESIVKYGDRCYWITDDYRKAFAEYQTLLISSRTGPMTSAAAQKHFIEISMLLSKHKNLLRMREDDAKSFNNAHEIYEILTAGGILDELERTLSIAQLVSRQPEEVPNRIVNPHYERSEVKEMFNLNYRMFMELLEDEEEQIQTLKTTIFKSKETAEEENWEMKKLMHDMREMLQSLTSTKQAEITTDLTGIKQSIKEVKKAIRIQEILHNTRDEKINSIEESIKKLEETINSNNTELIGQTIKKIEETSASRTKQEIKTTRSTATQTGETHETRDVATQIETSNSYNIHEEDIGSISFGEEEEPLVERPTDKETRKRRRSTTQIERNLYAQRQKLEQLTHQEAATAKKMKFTTRNYGARIKRAQDLAMDCVFCGAVEEHYSDGCSVVRKTNNRKEIIQKEERCAVCLSKHHERQCRKYKECFYCTQEDEHHSALCPWPEQMANVMWQKRQTKREVEKIEKLLEQEERNHPRSSKNTQRPPGQPRSWGV